MKSRIDFRNVVLIVTSACFLALTITLVVVLAIDWGPDVRGNQDAAQWLRVADELQSGNRLLLLYAYLISLVAILAQRRATICVALHSICLPIVVLLCLIIDSLAIRTFGHGATAANAAQVFFWWTLTFILPALIGKLLLTRLLRRRVAPGGPHKSEK